MIRRLVVAAAVLAASQGLVSCAAVAFYERHVKALPCQANLCTDEEWAAQDPLGPVSVDLGPHRDHAVTVAP